MGLRSCSKYDQADDATVKHYCAHIPILPVFVIFAGPLLPERFRPELFPRGGAADSGPLFSDSFPDEGAKVGGI